MIRRLRERRLGVIYISHRLEEVFRIADRVTVLKDGSGEGTFPVRQVTSRDLVARMVGRGLDPHRPRHERPAADSPVALEVRGLSDDRARAGDPAAVPGHHVPGAVRGDRRPGRPGRGRPHRAGAGDLRRLARVTRRGPRHGPARRRPVPGRGDRGRASVTCPRTARRPASSWR